MNNVIYGLLDPNTKELRYIGKTNDIATRFRHHYVPKKLAAKSHKNSWLKSLLTENKKAEVIILEIYDTYKELDAAEIELIEYYRYIGCDLTNGTKGGEGSVGRVLSEESKNKISIARKGKRNSIDTEFKYGKKWVPNSATKLNLEIATSIRKDHSNGMSGVSIANKYKISKGHVSRIINNIDWNR